MKNKEELSWTPVLRGSVYCSSACGGGAGVCDKEKYDLAVKSSNALAKRLGKGWKPTVHENLGWFWGAYKGVCHVSPSGWNTGKLFTCYLNTTPQFIERDTNPVIAVKRAMEDFDQHLNCLHKQREQLGKLV